MTTITSAQQRIVVNQAKHSIQVIGPIPGPPGNTGPMGPQGPQGIPGETGDQGPAGPLVPFGNLTDVDLSGLEDGDLVFWNLATGMWEATHDPVIKGTISLSQTPGLASKKADLGEGYGLYSDNDGPGSDDTRLWVDAPEGGAVYIGPRAGGELLDVLGLRSAFTQVDGDMAVDGQIRTTEFGGDRAIIESGSGFGVNFIKYADGTCMQWYRHTTTTQAITSAYGSLYIGERAYTWPVTFVEIPIVTIGEAKWGTSASWGQAMNATVNGFSLRIYDVNSRATGTSTVISWVAIGKWA